MNLFEMMNTPEFQADVAEQVAAEEARLAAIDARVTIGIGTDGIRKVPTYYLLLDGKRTERCSYYSLARAEQLAEGVRRGIRWGRI